MYINNNNKYMILHNIGCIMLNRILFLLIIISVILIAGPAGAGSDTGVDSPAEVEMNIQLDIPPHVSLRIGSGGTVIDTVTFIVTGTPRDMPVVTSEIAPEVVISTNVNTGITLRADSSSALVGELQTIPFTAISFQGTGEFEGAEAPFDGSPSQTIRSFGARGTYSGRFNFTFQNRYEFQPGDYSGTVFFTVTSP